MGLLVFEGLKKTRLQNTFQIYSPLLLPSYSPSNLLIITWFPMWQNLWGRQCASRDLKICFPRQLFFSQFKLINRHCDFCINLMKLRQYEPDRKKSIIRGEMNWVPEPLRSQAPYQVNLLREAIPLLWGPSRGQPILSRSRADLNPTRSGLFPSERAESQLDHRGGLFPSVQSTKK